MKIVPGEAVLGVAWIFDTMPFERSTNGKKLRNILT